MLIAEILPGLELFLWNSYYAFEAHTGNTSSIYLGAYLADADSFSIIAKVLMIVT